MANVAQLVNTIHSLFLAHEDKFIVTPNYHVFAMYASHMNGKAVRTVFSAPTVGFTRPAGGPPPAAGAPPAAAPGTLWGLNGSASLRDKELTVTVVNPHATDARACAVTVKGASVRDARALVLSSADLRAHNSFERPSALAPREAPASGRGASFVHTFAPASVTRLTLILE